MLDLIKRVTPDIAESFAIAQIDSEKGHDTYEIGSSDGKILLRGSSNVALAVAYYRYLQEFCNVNLSWSANREAYAIDNPPLPCKKTRYVIENDKRMCLSYSTYANGACYWDWQRWEREIDFMAMNGVNMPLCIVGQEAVWYYAMLKLDVNREDALEFLSGAAYYPLQLAGKLDSFLPLTDIDYLKSRIELGKKILERVRSFGMKPILQGFNGHVPKTMKGYYSKADIIPVTPFGSFAGTYRVSPTDPLFAKIGTALFNKQKELFGTAEYYLACPFSEVELLVRGFSFQKDYGRVISAMIEQNVPNAVWVLDSSSYTKQLVSGVDKGRLLVIDTFGDAYQSTDRFEGHNFIVGTAFNRCGRTTLFGNLPMLAGNQYAIISRKYDNAVGAGVFPESIEGNSMYANLALEMLTANDKIKLDKWLDSYSMRRWGADERCLRQAAALLAETCYSEDCTGSETGSIIAARPSTELLHTAPFDTLELKYDNQKLCSVLQLMLSSKGEYTDGYVYDVCDITRQLLSNHARKLYTDVMAGYNNRDARLFETSTNAFLKLLEELDELLNTVPEFRLSEHLDSASGSAVGKADKQNFEITLLCYVSLFGPFSKPEYYDFCWREWSDLTGVYFAMRWHKFFDMLAKNFNKRKRISTVTKQLNGRNLSRGNRFYKTLDTEERAWISKCKISNPGDGDTLEIAGKLFKKYSEMILSDKY